jgi:thiol-disulfide isomerase/thioredoxin
MVSLHAVVTMLSLAGAGQTELLNFDADWSPPCRKVDTTVRDLIVQGYPVQKVNIDREHALAVQYDVTKVPCFVMVVHGREVARVVGTTSMGQLEQRFQLAGVVAHPTRTTAAAKGATGGPPHAAPALDDASLIAATVRVKVEDPDGHSWGTGTIIYTYSPGESLVLTCAQIFRDSQGKGRIEVDLFGPKPVRRIAGRLIGYDMERDVALVAIRAPRPVTAVPVAPRGYKIRRGDAVASVGCNNGETPTVHRSHVVSIDRFLGPPNIQVAGEPIVGRSGGGLFAADGSVIGVCNAADPTNQEGLFAGLASIQVYLDQLGLSHVCSPQVKPVPAIATRSCASPRLTERKRLFTWARANRSRCRAWR